MSQPINPFAELKYPTPITTTTKPGPTEQELAEREAKADERRLERERHEGQRRGVACRIPRRYQWALTHADPLGALKFDRAKFAEALDAVDTSNVVIRGGTGRGKTTIGTLLLHNRAVARLCGFFVSVVELETERRQGRLGEAEGPLITNALTAELLLLDDVGAESAAFSQVSHVMHRRYDDCLPTIITTGFPESWLNERYGSAIVRRMYEGATILDLVGKP